MTTDKGMPSNFTRRHTCVLLMVLATCAAFALLCASRQNSQVALAAVAAGEGSTRAPALTEKLENIFSAPLDVLAGYMHQMTADSSSKSRSGQQYTYAEYKKFKETPREGTFFHNAANRGNPQTPSARGWGLNDGWDRWGQTGNMGDSGRVRAEHGNFDGSRSAVRLPLGVHPYTRQYGEPWTGVRHVYTERGAGASPGRTNDFQVIGTGPRTPSVTPTEPGYRVQYGTQYSKTESVTLPQGPAGGGWVPSGAASGWYPYDVPAGTTSAGLGGEETRFASIRVDETCGGPAGPPCQGKAHLELQVYCPPYVAPSHGSVWYKGKEFFEATAPAPASRSIISLPVGGDSKIKCPSGSTDCAKGIPAAVVGVDIPEGERVQVACKDHYRLTEAGSEFPKCLKSGQFEKGKECEPIMCSAYKPPENGGVWPDTPVQAGARVTIYCFPGYEEDYDDYWPFQANVPRADFDKSGARINSVRRLSRLAARLRVRVEQPQQTRAAVTRALTRGRGRVRHANVAALLRAKAAARLRQRQEDRARLPAEAADALPVIPRDDVLVGSQKTVDAMVQAFVHTGFAGIEPPWAHKRLSYAQALGKESRGRPAGGGLSRSVGGGSSSYALRMLEGQGGGGSRSGGGKGDARRRMRRSASSNNTPESDPQSAGQIDAHRAPDGSLHDALARQRLAMDAEGADAEGRYAVAAATDAHLDTDYKYALIDAAAGSGDKLTRDMVPVHAMPASNTPREKKQNPMHRSPWQDKPKKQPACQDSTRYERGITCRPLPRPFPQPPTPPPPPPPGGLGPSGGFRQAPTTTSVPEQWRDMPPPVTCSPYVPPRHGSAWYKGKEYRIATPTVPERESVTLTCDENFRLSDRGSRWPECLHDGRWDIGKTCEALMCPAYKAPEHGSVDICDAVQAGTRVTIECDSGWMAYGEEAGGRRSPKCLADGSYERGVECVPRPCPKRHKIPLPADEPCEHVSEARASAAHPPSVAISQHEIKDWEQGLERQDAYDYTPNVFDHEPRPYQIPHGMDDWRVHEGSTRVVATGATGAPANDPEGPLIKHDVGSRWWTHQTGETDSPVAADWKGPWGFDGKPDDTFHPEKNGVNPPLSQIGV